MYMCVCLCLSVSEQNTNLTGGLNLMQFLLKVAYCTDSDPIEIDDLGSKVKQKSMTKILSQHDERKIANNSNVDM